MKLFIDGAPVEAAPGETLLGIIRRLGMDDERLSVRPLAARIAGEVFTLNYVPLRISDFKDTITFSMREAIEASGGEIHLIRYSEPSGRRVYERTSLFVLLLAIRRALPDAVAKVNYSLGAGIFVSLDKSTAVTDDDIEAVKRAFSEIVSVRMPLLRKRLDIKKASAFFLNDGQPDKVKLLSWRKFTYFDVYSYLDYMEYFYGEMAPDTGYISVWDILRHKEGLVLIQPDSGEPDRIAAYKELPRFSECFERSDKWCSLMGCSVVAELNELASEGRLRELIRVNEGLHEKRFSQISDDIISRGAKIVLIAGPSSSGKTTSANRLCVQLRVHGKKPMLISLDDYYLDRDTLTPDENGEIDLENINTIDCERISSDVAALIKGGTVNIPRFDFKLQKRVDSDKFITLDEDSVLVIEGIHGLNPQLLSDDVDKRYIYRMYVSALLPLNLDNHNRIPTTYLRLLRRIVRDYETRGSSVERTLSMWASVRRGEEKWIFPYQEYADVIFDSSLVYELCFLKRHVYPLLKEVRPGSPHYEEARYIVKILNYICESDVEDEIPPTSILREFIGGNTFYK